MRFGKDDGDDFTGFKRLSEVFVFKKNNSIGIKALKP